MATTTHTRALLSALSAACSACEAPDGAAVPIDSGAEAAACGEVVLAAFNPEKARFVPGEEVQLGVDVDDAGAAACDASLRLTVTRMGDVVHTTDRAVRLPAYGPARATLAWDAPDDDFRGYLAQLEVVAPSAAPPAFPLDPEVPGFRTGPVVTTGVDVSSASTRYPRYGYLSVFPPGQSAETSRAIVEMLTQNFHLDMFQFYDWFWRHEDLVPRDPDGAVPAEWEDLFGRVNARATIDDLVAAIHDENAAAMAYTAMYAGREGYAELSGVSPAWGLYETPLAERQLAIAFGNERYLFLFDPTNPAWQARMSAEYADAARTFAFDGVHIDQFGPRPAPYRSDGTQVALEEAFAPFLGSVDASLAADAPGHDLCIFNLVEGAVDGFGVLPVARSPACDVLYSEIWFTTNTYEQLVTYIEQLRKNGRGRAVVLALYPQYGEDVGIVQQAEGAARLEGVAVDADHAGYTGAGFIDQFDAVGDAVEWRFTLSEASTVTFVFRYANATGATATRTVVLDGVDVGEVRMPPLGTWDDWSFNAWLQQGGVAAGEHVVTLRYAEDDVGSVNVDRLTLGEFDADSVRLQNAVVFAAGATPIQLGDDVQSLSHEYFPNRSKVLTPGLQRALAAQYSFVTAHEELLFSPDVVPIAERLERVQAVSPGHRLITGGTGGIWTLLRQGPAGDVIHLVNLVGVDNDLWRDAAPEPAPLADITLRYTVDDAARVRRALWATPDEGLGAFETLELVRGDGWVEITVPRLSYWDVVLVQYE